MRLVAFGIFFVLVNSLSLRHESRVASLAVQSVTEIVIVGEDQYTKVANRHEAVVVNAVGSNRVTELRGRGREGGWQLWERRSR